MLSSELIWTVERGLSQHPSIPWLPQLLTPRQMEPAGAACPPGTNDISTTSMNDIPWSLPLNVAAVAPEFPVPFDPRPLFKLSLPKPSCQYVDVMPDVTR